MINQCKIYSNSLGNEFFIVSEMMYGMHEKFTYFRCSSCGCLQILEPPKEIAKYYPNESYYSFQQLENRTVWYERLKNKIKYAIFNTFFCSRVVPFFLKKTPDKYFKGLVWLKMLIQQKAIKKTSSILDVGCGNGELLQKMNLWGLKNLMGIDPFLEKDILYSSGVRVLKQDIFHHVGTYDLIMLHHSFEHMDNPKLILKQLYKMLNPNGYLLIRIPVSDSFAWRKYGVNWDAIDAPRHFFLHTTNSMDILGKNTKFILKQVVCDSAEDQFLRSEKHSRNIPQVENFDFSPKYVKTCKKHARWLNQTMDGDRACYLFQKEESNDIN